jgi:hypothetical protein
MNDRDQQNEFPASQEELRAALLRLNARRIAVPAERDEAVLWAASEQLNSAVGQAPRLSNETANDRDARFTSLGWLGGLISAFRNSFSPRRLALVGAAAVVIVAVGALLFSGGRAPLMAKSGDLNGDGVVDMLDAFALARELEADAASRPQHDLNGDGVVDGRDVQILAARAVNLEHGGRS